MSLRKMSEQARMGKDKVSESLKKLVDIGLILEKKGPTSEVAELLRLARCEGPYRGDEGQGHFASGKAFGLSLWQTERTMNLIRTRRALRIA
jgi:hypothetical protein